MTGAPPAASATEPTRTMRSALGSAIAMIDGWRGRSDRGSLAELRRLRDDEVPPEAFWSLVAATQSPVSQELFWRAILPLMVLVPHRPGVFLGEALQQAGVSAARVERWLRLDRGPALKEARKLLRRLEAVDWLRLGASLHRWDDPARTEIARHFFRAQYRAATSTAEVGS